jgi:nucleoside-diphosphate-sugar epimerase
VRVLVAGHRGYIGTVLTGILREAGHDWVGLDSGLYEGCDFLGGPGSRTGLPVDLRDVQAHHVEGFDAVICLAALSNDPLGHLDPTLTESINLGGTMQLARAAKSAGVGRFVFASSCSLYGAAGTGLVAEDAELNPVTPYGEAKVAAEQQLSLLADDTFSPTYLRNATAFGPSPRLRLDIVVNNLVGWAITTGEIRLMSDGSPWRPLVHVDDISRAAVAALQAPREAVHDEAFNVGCNANNVRIRDVAQMVEVALPECKVTFSADAGPDSRDYRVDFSKAVDVLGLPAVGTSVPEGIDQLAKTYLEHGLDIAEFNGSSFIRLNRIQQLLDEGVIDRSLRVVSGRPGIDGTDGGRQ